jgi:hypothetical protein
MCELLFDISLAQLNVIFHHFYHKNYEKPFMSVIRIIISVVAKFL